MAFSLLCVQRGDVLFPSFPVAARAAARLLDGPGARVLRSVIDHVRLKRRTASNHSRRHRSRQKAGYNLERSVEILDPAFA
jgi:hypothetical protein